MRVWATRLARVGKVQSFDYPYMLQGRHRPDPLPTLIKAHQEALVAAAAHHRGPVILAGKSMGGRVGCHVSLESPPNALVCFGYPLLSAGNLQKVRDEVLKELRTPVLFLQGTRDPLCPIELLESVRRKMRAPNELYVVPSGDHSLQVTKTWLRENATGSEQVNAGILNAIQDFVSRHASPPKR